MLDASLTTLRICRGEVNFILVACLAGTVWINFKLLNLLLHTWTNITKKWEPDHPYVIILVT